MGGSFKTLLLSAVSAKRSSQFKLYYDNYSAILTTSASAGSDDAITIEVERVRLRALFMQSIRDQDSVHVTCKVLGLSNWDLWAIEKQTDGIYSKPLEQNEWHALWLAYLNRRDTFQQICDALGLGYSEEKAMREALIERSVDKGLSELDDVVDKDVSTLFAGTDSARNVSTAEEIINALITQGAAVQTLIGKFEGCVSRANSKIFIAAVKAVAHFTPETEWFTPLTEVIKSQNTVIADQKDTINDLQGRNTLLERQIGTATKNENKRQDALEELEDTVKKYGDELKTLREQVDALKSTIGGS